MSRTPGETLDAPTLERERRAGAGLTVEQAVALAREVARPLLGDEHVKAMWQTTGASDPPSPVARRQVNDLNQLSFHEAATLRSAPLDPDTAPRVDLLATAIHLRASHIVATKHRVLPSPSAERDP